MDMDPFGAFVFEVLQDGNRCGHAPVCAFLCGWLQIRFSPCMCKNRLQFEKYIYVVKQDKWRECVVLLTFSAVRVVNIDSNYKRAMFTRCHLPLL